MPFLSGFSKPIIAVDFDGTIKSTTNWLDMSTPLMPFCKQVLTELHNKGCTLLLWTSREGEDYDKCISYLKEHGLYHMFETFNDNSCRIDFETSRKIYADVYVDDHNAGGFIGWLEVRKYVLAKMVEN